MTFIIFICQRLITEFKRVLWAYCGYKLGREFAPKIIKEWKDKKPAEHGISQYIPKKERRSKDEEGSVDCTGADPNDGAGGSSGFTDWGK